MWTVIAAALAVEVVAIGEPVPVAVEWPEGGAWMVWTVTRDGEPVPDPWLRGFGPSPQECFIAPRTFDAARCAWLGEPGVYTIAVGANRMDGTTLPAGSATVELRLPTLRDRALALTRLDHDAVQLATPHHLPELVATARDGEDATGWAALSVLAQVPDLAATDALLAFAEDPARRLRVLELLCERAAPPPSPMAPNRGRVDEAWFQQHAWTADQHAAALALAATGMDRGSRCLRASLSLAAR